jgi:hypothetical protein
MRELVREELTRIPDWPDPQNELRMVYWMRRMRSLGRKATREQSRGQVLRECVGVLQREYPTHAFRFDEQYFSDEGSTP